MRCPKTLVVIPFGPGRDVSFLSDTIRSVLHHFKAGQTRIAVVNDSPHNLETRLQFPAQSVAIYPAKRTTRDGNTILRGAILLNQLDTIRKELQRMHFDVAVKMDDDALVCGDDPHIAAIDYFNTYPEIGLLGAFTIRGDGSSKHKAMAKKGKAITRILRMERFANRVRVTKRFSEAVREILLGLSLRYLDHEASKQSAYTRGDTCTGGCYFLSRGLLDRIKRRTFSLRPLAYCDEPGEDTLMALICYSLGLTVADYPNSGSKIAINWRGLPASPETLVNSDITIVHPVKGDPDYCERYIRERIGNALRDGNQRMRS